MAAHGTNATLVSATKRTAVDSLGAQYKAQSVSPAPPVNGEIPTLMESLHGELNLLDENLSTLEERLSLYLSARSDEVGGQLPVANSAMGAELIQIISQTNAHNRHVGDMLSRLQV